MHKDYDRTVETGSPFTLRRVDEDVYAWGRRYAELGREDAARPDHDGYPSFEGHGGMDRRVMHDVEIRRVPEQPLAAETAERWLVWVRGRLVEGVRAERAKDHRKYEATWPLCGLLDGEDGPKTDDPNVRFDVLNALAVKVYEECQTVL